MSNRLWFSALSLLDLSFHAPLCCLCWETISSARFSRPSASISFLPCLFDFTFAQGFLNDKSLTCKKPLNYPLRPTRTNIFVTLITNPTRSQLFSVARAPKCPSYPCLEPCCHLDPEGTCCVLETWLHTAVFFCCWYSPSGHDVFKILMSYSKNWKNTYTNQGREKLERDNREYAAKEQQTVWVRIPKRAVIVWGFLLEARGMEKLAVKKQSIQCYYLV